MGVTIKDLTINIHQESTVLSPQLRAEYILVAVWRETFQAGKLVNECVCVLIYTRSDKFLLSCLQRQVGAESDHLQ